MDYDMLVIDACCREFSFHVPLLVKKIIDKFCGKYGYKIYQQLKKSKGYYITVQEWLYSKRIATVWCMIGFKKLYMDLLMQKFVHSRGMDIHMAIKIRQFDWNNIKMISIKCKITLISKAEKRNKIEANLDFEKFGNNIIQITNKRNKLKVEFVQCPLKLQYEFNNINYM